MRPLLVKRQTTPESGFLHFFPPCQRRRGWQSVSCPRLLSVHGRNHTWRPHTPLEGPSSRTGRGQRRVAVLLCTRAMLACPRPVRFIRPAERVGRARSWQARGRGRTRQPCASTRRLCRRQSGGPRTRQGSGSWGRHTPWRSKTPARRPSRGLEAGAAPAASREAPGASALLPQAPRQRSRAPAVGRVSRSSPARPR
jgi:hypothetical protein